MVGQLTIARVLFVGCCLTWLVACGGTPPPAAPPAPPGPPEPAVRVTEISARIADYAERIHAEVLDPTFVFESDRVAARFSPRKSCADLPVKGPDWGVAPDSPYTIGLGAQDPAKYFDAIKKWLGDNGFGDLAENTIAVSGSGKPGQTRTLRGHAPDGIGVQLQLDSDWTASLSLVFDGPCAWPGDRPGGPPPSVLPPAARPSGPIQAAGDETACEKPERYVYNIHGPRYSGPGPHWITLIKLGKEERIHDSGFFLPAQWQPKTGADALGPVDRSRVQLVACLTPKPGSPSGRQVTCPFEKGPLILSLFEATYEVSVLEAATGRRVAAFSVPGTESDQGSCPVAVRYRPGDGLLRGIDIAAFHGTLRPLVEEAR
ncbi:hypothetical protein [Amycolatopsis samaneae]|uniref:Uncharacterized protein n=1 Tax=Amycolatopsis samaneae TaxID=664691 RepID=A0ABW5GWH2_9PSEU